MSDLHAPFDAGYLTVTPTLEVRVSRRLHDDFDNGRAYYAYQGRRLSVVPDEAAARLLANWQNSAVVAAHHQLPTGLLSQPRLGAPQSSASFLPGVRRRLRLSRRRRDTCPAGI